jgi:hypothetical protein
MDTKAQGAKPPHSPGLKAWSGKALPSASYTIPTFGVESKRLTLGSAPVELIEIGLRRSNGDGIPIALSPSDKTGLKRRNLIHLTARMPLVNSEATSRIPEREKTAFRPCVLGS